MPRFYFDHNATTPVDPRVLSAFVEAQQSCVGNASSIHQEGQFARQTLERSRRTVAAALGAQPNEVVFTSGGTEANNLAVLGLVRNLPATEKHVVTTSIEHPAVLEACRQLEGEGVSVTRVPAESDGSVSVAAVAAAIQPHTVLVSVMHANNETGVIQPLAGIAEVIAERRAQGQLIYFHSDGVQALGKVPVDVAALGVHLYSVSGHKLYAPKGVGALFVKKNVPVRGISFGGRHERERRAGTENVAGAAAFAYAVTLIDEVEAVRLGGLRDLLESEVRRRLPHAIVNADNAAARLPNTTNFRFTGLSGESLVIALDLKGFAVSSGSACSSGSLEPSPVLLAMGLSAAEARSSVRISLGHGNDEAQVLALAEALEAVARPERSGASYVASSISKGVSSVVS